MLLENRTIQLFYHVPEVYLCLVLLVLYVYDGCMFYIFRHFTMVCQRPGHL